MFRLLSLLIASSGIANTASNTAYYPVAKNQCVTFSVGPGTGCAWMCDYCAGALGTNNYYFIGNICTYQTGGCVGNPQAGVPYSCCAL